jgi:hypothetical protein
MSQATATSDGWLSQVDWNRFNNTAVGFAPVTSVFNRTGAIAAQEIDYSAYYPRLSSTYANPPWITSLDYGKISNAPIPVVYRDSIQSLAGTGPDLNSNVVTLIGDVPTPAASLYYGTNAAGTRGYFALPTGALPAGTASELQYRGSASAFGAFPSSVSGTAPDLTLTLGAGYPAKGQLILQDASTYGAGGLMLRNTGSGGVTVLQTLGPGAGLYLTDGTGQPLPLVLGTWTNPADGSKFLAQAGAFSIPVSRLYAGAYSGSPDTQLGVAAGAANRVGIAIQGAASQTADLQEWQNSGGTVLASVNAAGMITLPADPTSALQAATKQYVDAHIGTGAVTGSGTAGTMPVWTGTSTMGNSLATIDGTGVFTIPLVTIHPYGSAVEFLQNDASKTAGLWFTSNVTNSNIQFNANNSTNKLQLTRPSVGAGSRLNIIYGGFTGSIDVLSPAEMRLSFPNGPITVWPGTASIIGLTVKGLASQTADLQEWQNSGGTVLASVSASGVFTSVGTATNDNAAAGNVGQIISSAIASTAAIAIAAGTVTNITSLSLTAGDWDVRGTYSCYITSMAAGVVAQLSAGIGSTSATINDDGYQTYAASSNSAAGTTTIYNSCQMPPRRISLSAAATIYLCGKSNVAGNGFGYIEARRVR